MIETDAIMKKVLVLTYYWPPGSSAGVYRWLKFTKYLREFGWEPVIYTATDASHALVDTSLEGDVPPGVEVLRRPVWEPYAAYRALMGRGTSAPANPGGLEDGAARTGLGPEAARWIRGNLFIPDARCYWIRPSAQFLLRWLAQNPVDAIASTGPPHSMHLIGRALKRRLDIPWLADFRDPWTKGFL